MMSEADWPNNGVEFNRWYGLPLFLRVMSLFRLAEGVSLQVRQPAHRYQGT